MAASTIEVLLKFTGDPRNAKDAIAQVRADLTKSAQDQVSSARNANRQVATEARNQTRNLEREERQRVRASESLQRQRSAALIAEWRRQEREAARSAKQIADNQIRESRRAADAQLREAKRWAGIVPQGTGSGSSSSLLAGAAGGIAALVGISAISEIRQGAAAWFEYSSKLEATRIAFTTMLGSAQAASAHLEELQQFALTTPFEFSDLVDASQRMQALGFNAQQVVPILTDVGNAVAAAGGGSERLDRVVLALSQIQSKGKVATQELNQLAESGIPAFKILTEATGKSRAEIAKLVEEGRISSKFFLDAFQKFSQANFGGLMEKQSRTAIGALSNIKDAVLQLSDRAFEPLFTMISDGLSSIAKDLQTNQSSWEAWGRTISTSVATNVRGIVSLVSEIKNLDRQIAESLNLPALQAAVKQAGEAQQQSTQSQLAIALALISQLRGQIAGGVPGGKPQRFEDTGEFAIAGSVPSPLPPSPAEKPTEKKLGEKGPDPARTAQRIAEITLGITVDGLNAEEAAVRRSLARREIDFETYVAKLEALESLRQIKILSGLRLEAEEAEKLRDSNQKTIQLKEIDKKLEQEKNRHTQFGNRLDDERLDLTRQIIDFIEKQNREIANAIVKTGEFVGQVDDLVRSLAEQGVELSKTQEHWLRFNATLADSREGVKKMLDLMRELTDAVPAPGGPVPGLTPQQLEGNILTPQQQQGLGLPPAETLDALVRLATEAGGVFGGLGTIISNTFNLGASGAVAFADTLSSAFGQVAQAVGDAVHAFVLFGTVEGGFKKFAAEVIASLAAQATVQALFQFAQGLAWLALNFFFPNPQYALAATTAFASAAAFGLIAGVTVPLGRAIAGNSFSQAGAGSSGGGGGGSTSTSSRATGSSQPATVEFDRRAANQQAITVMVNIKRDEGSIVDAVVQDANSGGRIRKLIQSEIVS